MYIFEILTFTYKYLDLRILAANKCCGFKKNNMCTVYLKHYIGVYSSFGLVELFSRV